MLRIEPPPLKDILEEPFNQIAQRLIAVEEIPTWEELVKLFNYLKDDKRLRYGRGHSMYSGVWPVLCDEENIYHAFCYEFVEKLAEEVNGLNVSGKAVEVCAGNGKLSYWLRHFGIPSIASDNYSVKEIEKDSKYVERTSHWQALRKYKPELVIGCWLPSGGIELDVLDSPYVRYYLNIGEGYMGCTGDERLWERTDVTYTYLNSTNQFMLSRTTFHIDQDLNNSFAALFTKT